jgi:hypothetical protein
MDIDPRVLYAISGETLLKVLDVLDGRLFTYEYGFDKEVQDAALCLRWELTQVPRQLRGEHHPPERP